MTGIARYAIAIAAGLAAMAGWSAFMVQKGVVKEQVRVHEIGKKTNERAKVARKKVDTKPPEQIRTDLRRYCIDCDK